MVERTAQNRGDSDLFVLAAWPETRLDECLRRILQTATEITGADAGAAVLIADPISGRSIVELLPLQSAPMRPRAELLRECKAICDGAAAYENGRLFKGDGAVARVPIRLRDDVLGLIQVESARARAFSAADSRRLSMLADDVAVIVSRLLLREYAAEHGFDINLVGGSRRLLEIEEQVHVAASDSRSPVLIVGERGSGKELIAYAVHYFSQRRSGPFVPVNSAAFADTLSADELFGHEKHSFTGAETSRAGIFKAAEGGTLFFDEIGDMASPIQASLLRVLDHGELRRIGRDTPTKVNVRVVCATNRDLRKMVEQGTFRADLYDRLNVFRIEVPALRERREDIELLATYFLKKICNASGRHADASRCISCCHMAKAACAQEDFFAALSEYAFPGNIRELRNVITRVASANSGRQLGAQEARRAVDPIGACEPGNGEARLDAVIRDHIQKILRRTGNNKSEAARLLGVPLTTLAYKMKKLGM